MVDHPAVGSIAFTCSGAAGRDFNQVTAKPFKKVVLELGGKAACFVFPAEATSWAVFSNAGETVLPAQDCCFTETKPPSLFKRLRSSKPHSDWRPVQSSSVNVQRTSGAVRTQQQPGFGVFHRMPK
ncbi:aldehyde dehydrogenase family protein [Bradyrhizobium sp. DASA03076]|uniref:aldehyde dehydrogenase family protein n=1 Tax=Bradyrhizobium sp. BLXBL-03 TaxID=3395916 RepID=UPI003F7190B4